MRVTRPQILRIYDEIVRIIKLMHEETLTSYIDNLSVDLQFLLNNLLDCLYKNPHNDIPVIKKHIRTIAEVSLFFNTFHGLDITKIKLCELEDSMSIMKLAFLETPFTSVQWSNGFSSYVTEQQEINITTRLKTIDWSK